ncbi:MAG: hypothetical protein HAW65_02170 [Alphaproteobacteria bacterium]|nr:hypothetical protein [Alphaproteobacteria bacterium]
MSKSNKKDAAIVGVATGGTAAASIGIAQAAGFSAITHSSGAAIITTVTGKMMAGTLGTLAAGTLAAPVTAVATVAVVSGGLFYLYKKLTN